MTRRTPRGVGDEHTLDHRADLRGGDVLAEADRLAAPLLAEAVRAGAPHLPGAA